MLHSIIGQRVAGCTSATFHNSVPDRSLPGLGRDADRGLLFNWQCVTLRIRDRDPAEAQGNYEIS